MSAPTFTPPQSPSEGATDKPEIKLLEADFGDGYTQPTPDGLNHIRRVLTLRWELLEVGERNSIVDFLIARKGNEPFLYTLPGDSSPTLWTCKDWTKTARGADLWDVDAIFRQIFTAAAS